MTIELQKHHLVLYALLAVVVLVLAGVFHQWRLDLTKAEFEKKAQDQVIAAANKRDADRQKQFEQTAAQINALKVTDKTPTQTIVERIPQLINFPTPVKMEATMSEVNGQLIPPKPDAPKPNLVLDPAQQVVLVNRLADCKLCDAEREKLKQDLADAGIKFAAVKKERDGFETAAKGGSLWTRVKRRAWHFAEDAIIIEGARCVMGHC